MNTYMTYDYIRISVVIYASPCLRERIFPRTDSIDSYKGTTDKQHNITHTYT